MSERRAPYVRITDRESGLVFLFAPDAAAPELLHIFARHTTEPDDAIETFSMPVRRQPGTRPASGSRPIAGPMACTGSGKHRSGSFW